MGFDGPITSISVDELVELGLGELAAGDLNDDGWLDVDDVEAFANGASPGPVQAVGRLAWTTFVGTEIPKGVNMPPPALVRGTE